MSFPLKAMASLALAFVVLGASAQELDYIDVESERKAQRAAEAARGYGDRIGNSRFALGRAQPRPSQQAQNRGAAAGGMSNSALTQGTQGAAAGDASNPPLAQGTQGVAAGDMSNLPLTQGAAAEDMNQPPLSTPNASLFNQLQQLRQEVMRLNGRVEELSYEVRRLKSDNLNRYKDLDRRLSGGAAAPKKANAKPKRATTPSKPRVNKAVKHASAGEQRAYRTAYGYVREQQFKAAIKAFKAFLRNYPEGRYAPNAHYWLGELYLVVTPPDLESSRRAFNLLLQDYPKHPKVPDALFKLGKVYYLKGNPERGKTYLDRLLRDYGSSNHSAVKLARQFLKDNS